MIKNRTPKSVADRAWLGAVWLCLVSLCSCSGPNPDSMFAAATDSNAKRLGTLYGQFQLRNKEDRLAGPTSKEDFLEFIKEQKPDHLLRIGVDVNDLEAIFKSERDDLPFKIRWEVKGSMRGPAKPVIFESAGRDGKFLVGYTGFVEKEVDQSEYDRLWSGAGDEEGDNQR